MESNKSDGLNRNMKHLIRMFEAQVGSLSEGEDAVMEKTFTEDSVDTGMKVKIMCYFLNTFLNIVNSLNLLLKNIVYLKERK